MRGLQILAEDEKDEVIQVLKGLPQHVQTASLSPQTLCTGSNGNRNWRKDLYKGKMKQFDVFGRRYQLSERAPG